MKKYGSLLFGLILQLNCPVIRGAAMSGAQRAVDILLPCEYVLLERGVTGLAFSRQKVTMVLRNVMTLADLPEEPLPGYQTPEDPETAIFEATVNLPPLPFAERLLHVECEGEEITCEITPLYSHFYIAHIRLPEVNIALVAKASSTIDPEQPLDDKSIIQVSVDQLVSSKPPSQRGVVSNEVLLSCEVWGNVEEADMEWHHQKEGKGKKITPGEDLNVSVKQERQDGKEESSLTIPRLTVHDEGTYICAVSVGSHRLQQILQLHIKEPPHISLSLSEDPRPILTCRTDRYYPLDVEVKWLLNGAPLTDTTPYTSSHRRNSDGTYNLSSHLQVSIPLSGVPADVYTCSVSHASSEDPIQVSINVNQPGCETPPIQWWCQKAGSSCAYDPAISSHIVRFTVAFIGLVLALSAIYTCARTIPHGGQKAKLP